MTWTITRPTTSSSIAAVLRTTPILVFTNPLVLRTANVVPRLVEQSAAPAAKAWRGVALASLRRTKDKAIGNEMPVSATATERWMLALRDLNDVERPPARVSRYISILQVAGNIPS